jgi:hypothetical protein
MATPLHYALYFFDADLITWDRSTSRITTPTRPMIPREPKSCRQDLQLLQSHARSCRSYQGAFWQIFELACRLCRHSSFT